MLLSSLRMGVYRTTVRGEIESIIPQELQEQYLMEVVFAFGALCPPKEEGLLSDPRNGEAEYQFQIINAWMFVSLLPRKDKNQFLF